MGRRNRPDTRDRAQVRNAADPEQVRKADERERNRREEELNDLRYVMGHVRGRRYLWRQLKSCRIYEADYLPSGSETYYRDGERNRGIALLSQIMEADLEGYLTMQKEARDREENGDA